MLSPPFPKSWLLYSHMHAHACRHIHMHTYNTHRHTHLACGFVCGDEDIPCSKVAMNKPFGGQVQHTKGNLSTEAEEGGAKF